MKPLKRPLAHKHEQVNSRNHNPYHIPELYPDEIVDIAANIISKIREESTR